MALDRVGFVGVGLMGHGMAKNIVEKGHPLTIVAHRNREPVEDLKSRGAKEAANLHELAAAERHRRALRHRQPPGRGDPDRPRRPCLGRARNSSSATARPPIRPRR